MAFNFPDAPTVGAIYTPAGGPSWQWDGTAWVQTGALPGAGGAPRGDCYLDYAGPGGGDGIHSLSRLYGRHLFINGVNEVIPAAGITISGTGATTTNGYGGGAMHLIYAYMNAGVMTLERSATMYALDANTGVAIKAGDPSRTLVGAAGCPSTGWSAIATMVSSWFNPKPKTIMTVSSNPATASTGYVELSTALRAHYVTLGGREVHFAFSATVQCSVATADTYTTMGIDGVTGLLPAVRAARPSATPGSEQMPQTVVGRYIGTDNYHFITPIGAVSATNTGTWAAAFTEVTTFG